MLALKVCIIGLRESQEVAISHHIKSIDAEHHPGKAHLRVALEDFEVEGPCGRHQRLVFPCLGRSLSEVRDIFDDRALDKTLLQYYLYVIFTAKDFMHQVGIVHTGPPPHPDPCNALAETESRHFPKQRPSQGGQHRDMQS